MLGDGQQWIVVDAEFREHFVGGLLHDPGPRIEILVHAMAETHETEGVVLVLGPGHVLADPRHVADLFEHVQHGFVGAAVRGAPQRGDTRGDTGEGVGARGARQAHGGGRGILLVIGVEQENAVHGPSQHRRHLARRAGRAEHHVQEVFRVVQRIIGIHKGLADREFVAHGRQRGHFGDQAESRDLAMVLVGDIQGIVIEGRERADHAAHNGHGVRVAAEAVEEGAYLLMNHGVVVHGADKALFLRLVREFAVEQKIGGLQIVRSGRELFDGVAAVQQNALVAVDVGDFRLAGRSG